MHSHTISEHRQQTHKLAQELLEKRTQLWALREELVKCQPYTDAQPIEALARRFCQELIDYVSLEHFGIVQHLLDGHEDPSLLAELTDTLYPRIAATTDAALDFNDKCEALDPAALRRELPGELAVLDEALAVRVELEDRLIEAMTAA